MRNKSQAFRSLVGALGTAAGVAWPTFGIVSAAAGLTGLGAFVMSTTAIGLFFIFMLPIAVFSFKDFVKSRKKSQAALDTEKPKIIEALCNYLTALIQKYRSIRPFSNDDEVASYLQDTFKKDNHSLLVAYLGSDFFLKFVKKDNKNQVVSQALLEFERKVPAPREEAKDAKKAAYTGFAGSYGSVAGCTAGLCGMFQWLGVFPGFGLHPVLAVIVLGASVVVGLTFAGVCFYHIYREAQRDQVTKDYKGLQSELKMRTQINTNQALLRGRAQSQPSPQKPSHAKIMEGKQIVQATPGQTRFSHWSPEKRRVLLELASFTNKVPEKKARQKKSLV